MCPESIFLSKNKKNIIFFSFLQPFFFLYIKWARFRNVICRDATVNRNANNASIHYENTQMHYTIFLLKLLIEDTHNIYVLDKK